MQIKRRASCGTLESSDALVLVELGNGGTEIEINSPVRAQFKDEIMKTIEEVLKKHDISDVKLCLNDHGALDCTIKARLECALMRATEDL